MRRLNIPVQWAPWYSISWLSCSEKDKRDSYCESWSKVKKKKLNLLGHIRARLYSGKPAFLAFLVSREGLSYKSSIWLMIIGGQCWQWQSMFFSCLCSSLLGPTVILWWMQQGSWRELRPLDTYLRPLWLRGTLYKTSPTQGHNIQDLYDLGAQYTRPLRPRSTLYKTSPPLQPRGTLYKTSATQGHNI